MTPHLRTLRRLRRQIPAFACVPGCHDCCGPVMAASEEVSLLPPKSITEHEQAWAELDCPYLGKNGCEVYADRPLICRLFGTTPRREKSGKQGVCRGGTTGVAFLARDKAGAVIG